MPQFTWIGKDKVQNHDKDLPFRVLKPNPSLSVGTGDNLLIEGDNLEALKALMPSYYNKIKCIYIDPPYNTGNEKWIYNDKVNSPQIKAWLNKVVGAEGEDLSRHDKWLCMMYPRLKLLKDLLTDDGVLLVSIGDDELSNLLILLKEIFNKPAIAIFTWKSREKPTNAGKAIYKPQKVSEYILAFSKKSIEELDFQPLYASEGRVYPYTDEKGKYRTTTILTSNRGSYERKTMRVRVGNYEPPENQRWKFGNDEVARLYSEGYIGFRSNKPHLKVYELEERKLHIPLYTFIDYTDVGTAETGKTELNKILGNTHGFDTVKPKELVKFLIKAFSSSDSIILDSFAGTGTTGQAVLELNKEDDGNRRFVLVELETDIAREITSKRLKKVVEGYDSAEFPEGTGQGFQYLDLNGELFDSTGFINKAAHYEDMASYIYFTETHNYLDLSSIKNPYIGDMGQNHYYLLFSGKDKNILDEKSVKNILDQKGTKIVYADKCLLDEEFCVKNNIVFKQIPYELKKF